MRPWATSPLSNFTTLVMVRLSDQDDLGYVVDYAEDQDEETFVPW
jgi:hypothetical protein